MLRASSCENVLIGCPHQPTHSCFFNTNVLLGWEPLYRDPLSARGHRPFRSSFSLHATANDCYDPTLDITVYLRLKLTPHSLPTGRQHRTQKSTMYTHTRKSIYGPPSDQSVYHITSDSTAYYVEPSDSIACLRCTVRLNSLSMAHRQTEQPIYAPPTNPPVYLWSNTTLKSLSTAHGQTQQSILKPYFSARC